MENAEQTKTKHIKYQTQLPRKTTEKCQNQTLNSNPIEIYSISRKEPADLHASNDRIKPTNYFLLLLLLNLLLLNLLLLDLLDLSIIGSNSIEPVTIEGGYLSSINPESGLPYPLDEVGESCLLALAPSGTPDPAPVR